MKRKVGLLLITLMVLCIAAVAPIKAGAAGKVKLNKTKVVIELGKKEQLKVNNTTSKVKWSSSNKRVVKVNSKGVLTSRNRQG